MFKITLNEWIVINQISWMSLFGGTDTRGDLRCTGSARISAFPPGSTGESESSCIETEIVERGLFLTSRSTVSPSSDCLVLNVIESSARSFLKWDELRVIFRSALSAVSMLWYFLVTANGVGGYGDDSVSRFGRLTSTVSPTWMSQALTALLDSAFVLILSFCWASLLRVITSSWL